MNPWASIAITAIPEVAQVIMALLALRKAYPELTPEQIQAVVADFTTSADTAFDSVLARIAAENAKQIADLPK